MFIRVVLINKDVDLFIMEDLMVLFLLVYDVKIDDVVMCDVFSLFFILLNDICGVIDDLVFVLVS